MAPQFEKTSFEAPLGVLQKPFKTQFGWHVMVVNGRSGEEAPVPVAEVASPPPAPAAPLGKADKSKGKGKGGKGKGKKGGFGK